MTFGKGITKHNKEGYVKLLLESLDRFIAYTEKYGKSREQIVEEWSKDKSQKIDWESNRYFQYKEIAKHLKHHLDEIALHVHEFCFDPQRIGETVYPAQTLEILYRYRSFCYRNRVETPEENFMSLQEQNEATRNYVHFDFSVRKIKTLKDI